MSDADLQNLKNRLYQLEMISPYGDALYDLIDRYNDLVSVVLSLVNEVEFDRQERELENK